METYTRYKVVLAVSPIDDKPWGLRSVIAKGLYHKLYKPNTYTKALPKTGLLVFNTLMQAIDFWKGCLLGHSNYQIWEC